MQSIFAHEEQIGSRDVNARRSHNTKVIGKTKITAENIIAQLKKATTTSTDESEMIKMHERRLEVFRSKFVPFIESLLSSSDLTLQKVADYNEKEWGLRPGTQIFYKGAFGLDAAQHHGVYLGYGLVCEVGGKWCKSSKTGFLEQCLSINTLNDFVIRGKELFTKSFMVISTLIIWIRYEINCVGR